MLFTAGKHTERNRKENISWLFYKGFIPWKNLTVIKKDIVYLKNILKALAETRARAQGCLVTIDYWFSHIDFFPGFQKRTVFCVPQKADQKLLFLHAWYTLIKFEKSCSKFQGIYYLKHEFCNVADHKEEVDNFVNWGRRLEKLITTRVPL